jgi:hypothetical protein
MEPSLALLKKQVRADDFSQDDAYLEHLLDTAKETVITATNRTEAELREMDSEGHLPKMLLQAALMLAAHWYNQRESVAAVAMHEVPDSVQALVKPYRRLV